MNKIGRLTSSILLIALAVAALSAPLIRFQLIKISTINTELLTDYWLLPSLILVPILLYKSKNFGQRNYIEPDEIYQLKKELLAYVKLEANDLISQSRVQRTSKAKMIGYQRVNAVVEAEIKSFNSRQRKQLRELLAHIKSDLNSLKLKPENKATDEKAIQEGTVHNFIRTKPTSASKQVAKKRVLAKQEVVKEPPKCETSDLTDTIKVNYYSPYKGIPDDWKYPLSLFPNHSTKVYPYHVGTQLRDGYMDRAFALHITSYFGNEFDIKTDIHLKTGNASRPYEPDVALIDKKTDFNLRIDIEIDEPYAGKTREAIHVKGHNITRDKFFIDRGWIVVRFTERQVALHMDACVSYLFKLLESIGYPHLPQLNLKVLPHEDQWSESQALQWASEKYRENYLEIQDFGKVANPKRELGASLSPEEDAINEEMSEINALSSPINVAQRADNDDQPALRQEELLRVKNASISFDPDSHTYNVDGVDYLSVTQLVDKFFPAFDPVNTAKRVVANPNNANYGRTVEEMVRQYQEIGHEAREKGNLLHLEILRRIKNEPCKKLPEMTLFENFITDRPEVLQPYRSEWHIFDQKTELAGTIDMLVEREGGYVLYDWKRSRKIVDDRKEPINVNYWGKTALEPLKSLGIDDTSWNKYCLQQNLYAYILEHSYGLTILEKNIVVLHPDYRDYHCLLVPEMVEATKTIINHRKRSI